MSAFGGKADMRRGSLTQLVLALRLQQRGVVGLCVLYFAWSLFSPET